MFTRPTVAISVVSIGVLASANALMILVAGYLLAVLAVCFENAMAETRAMLRPPSTPSSRPIAINIRKPPTVWPRIGPSCSRSTTSRARTGNRSGPRTHRIHVCHGPPADREDPRLRNARHDPQFDLQTGPECGQALATATRLSMARSDSGKGSCSSTVSSKQPNPTTTGAPPEQRRIHHV